MKTKKMINTSEVKVGQKFKHDGEVWICTSNDGFIFSAENVDENATRTDIMFVGISEEIELV